MHASKMFVGHSSETKPPIGIALEGSFYFELDTKYLWTLIGINWEIFSGQNGSIGLTGIQGPRGFQGFYGPTGYQGYTGPQGSQGDFGPTGPIGPQGADNGPQGPTGPIGLAGSNGSQGPAGPQGASYIPRSHTIDPVTSIEPNVGNYDLITLNPMTVGVTIQNPTSYDGGPYDGQKLALRIKDSGSAQNITWSNYGTCYRSSDTITLPYITIPGKTFYLEFVMNALDSKWDVISFNSY